eukprot:455179-Pelagomonas_calceolata.AAC.2
MQRISAQERATRLAAALHLVLPYTLQWDRGRWGDCARSDSQRMSNFLSRHGTNTEGDILLHAQLPHTALCQTVYANRMSTYTPAPSNFEHRNVGSLGVRIAWSGI